MEGSGELGVQSAPGGGVSVASQFAFGHQPFQGYVRTKVEPSGRLPIPAAFKYAFEGVGVVRARRGQCLQLFTQQGFDAMVDFVIKSQGGTTDPVSRARAYKHAPRVSIDRQSRVVLPEDLRQKCRITEDVILLGAIESVEIWDLALYEEIEADRADEFDLLLDGHGGLPIPRNGT